MSILREIFSGANKKLSAKRVIGGIAMMVALGCTIYLVITEGSNSVVENLLMTVLIMAASLLGLPAVTGIWNKSKVSIENTTEQLDQPHELIESTNEPDDKKTINIYIKCPHQCHQCESVKKDDSDNYQEPPIIVDL